MEGASLGYLCVGCLEKTEGERTKQERIGRVEYVLEVGREGGR